MVKQILIAIDQLLNALLGGWADETLSSRAYRLSSRHSFWRVIRGLVDTIFFFDIDHCEESYKNEHLRRQLPPEFRTPLD